MTPMRKQKSQKLDPVRSNRSTPAVEELTGIAAEIAARQAAGQKRRARHSAKENRIQVSASVSTASKKKVGKKTKLEDENKEDEDFQLQQETRDQKIKELEEVEHFWAYSNDNESWYKAMFSRVVNTGIRVKWLVMEN